MTKRTVTNLTDNTVTEETYSYDAGGNLLTTAVDTASGIFVYDENNRLIQYNGQAVTYDADGNMTAANLDGSAFVLTFDSANRLISAGGNTYVYDVNNTRIRNLCGESETTYVYDIVSELSRLLVKTTDGVVTKYVYGNGLIGEETAGCFKTYHFDYRGSTTAITDSNGDVTDTFTYDAYGNLTSRTGTTEAIFLYNGRDGVVTDNNGLLYMRARYYSPELRRFISVDPLDGDIQNSPSLNRYAYANGNPVSNVDPFGLSAERGKTIYDKEYYDSKAYKKIKENANSIIYYSDYYGVDANVVAGVIFVEQYYNYDWKDVCADWISFYGIIDMSVGLGQVRLSTAQFLEDKGYVPKTSATEGGWNIPFIGFVHGTETMAREKRLENNDLNIMYVAAYIKAIEDIWEDEFPEISNRPDILGSLYNLGHEKKPHNNPEANWFGEHTLEFYDLMKGIFDND